MPQSEIARRGDAIEHELQTRTDRLAGQLRDEFDTDDAKSITDKEFHEMVRRNWSDPSWRTATAQRMGPVALYKVALDAFGLNADGSQSKDSHPDAKAAQPEPTRLKPPAPPEQPKSPPLPSVFPFQGPSLPQPTAPGLGPMPPPSLPPPPPGAVVGPPPPMQPLQPQGGPA